MSNETDNKDLVQKKISEDLRKAKEICLQHADDLVEASKLLIENKKFNLAHHMALLALEEVGKFELYRSSLIQPKENETSPLNKWSDNHEKKLFWAIWTPSLKELKPHHFLENQKLSKDLHELRLESLYTGINNGVIQAPRTISLDSCQATLAYTTTRVDQLRNIQFLESSLEEMELTNWFLKAVEDPTKRPYFFNASSIITLQEMNDVRKWIESIRIEISKGELEAAEVLKQELARSEQNGPVSGKQRWKCRIRLQTNTHSIRGNGLTWWNENINSIKLSPVGKQKDQIDVDIYLSDIVTAPNLYTSGETFFNTFVIALNLGTFGFFWRHMPYDEDKFFDGIDDLDHPNMKLQISNPSLLSKEATGNPQKRVLDKGQLELVASCLAFISKLKTQEERAPFYNYRSALNLLSLTNVHGDFRIAAFQSLHNSFKTAAILFGDIKTEDDFADFFKSYVLKEYGPEAPADHLVAIINNLDGKSQYPTPFTTDDLLSYKVFLEAYLATFMKKAVTKDILTHRKKN